MYLARNVDPEVGAPLFGGFNGLCAWVLESVLHLDGAATPENMKVFMQQACAGRGYAAATKAANEGPLMLPNLGPVGVFGTYGTPGLPLRVARLPTRTGGLALPQLHRVCRAAFVGQLMTTLCPRIVGMHADLRLDAGAASPAAQAAGPGAVHQLAAAEELRPLLQTLPTELRNLSSVYEEQALKSAAAAEGVPESQLLLVDDDGDVVMSSASHAGGIAAVNGGRGSGGSRQVSGRNGDPRPPGPTPLEPSAALVKLVPAALLTWAQHTEPSTTSALSALARAATASSAKTIHEQE
jgi:hypothetical protein